MYVKGYPVIEGLLNAVHLDHLIELEVNEEDLLKHTGETITLKSWAEDYFESASGRVVTIHVTHTAADGMLLARETERFAIRGRVYSDALPADAPEYGGALLNKEADGSVAGQSTGLSDSSRGLQSGQAAAGAPSGAAVADLPFKLPMPSACSWPTPPRCVSTRSAATTPPTP